MYYAGCLRPWLGQDLSRHDKLAKGQRQKTMEACALAGSPSDFVKVAGVVTVPEI